MSNVLDIILRPTIEAIAANHIVEIDSSNTVGINNIMKYCTENNARLTVVDQFQKYDADELKNKYQDNLEIFTEPCSVRLPLLDECDVILMDAGHDLSKLYNDLNLIYNKFSNRFPIIFLMNIGNKSSDKVSNKSELNEDINIYIQEKDLESKQLNIVKNFIDESDLELFFKYVDDVGILHLNDVELNKILIESLDDFNSVKILENDEMILIEDFEEYKIEMDDLRDRLDEKEIELDYMDNKYRSMIQRMISKFPSLYMFVQIPKTGIKNTLINRKGYKAIKANKLLDIGFYLKNSPDVKLKGNDPILHYIYHGFKEGRQPNHNFDNEYYIETHEDVKNSKLNPLVHYALFGINESRNPNFKENSELMGVINFKASNVVITGFLALVGDYSPREAIVKIDAEKFTVLCDEFSPTLEEKGINDGNHSFTLNVPPEFFDGKNHILRLFDKVTGELISTEKNIFTQSRTFKDLSGFLENSLVSPIVYAPFREQDKRCFATMEDIALYLINLTKKEENLPMVSVIMPVYNSIDTIKNSVDSVLNQTYSNLELIIVDGGSDDGTVEYLENIEAENVRIIMDEKCREISKARNMGVTKAEGEYIAYLEPNNTWDSRYLAAMIGAFLKLPDSDAVYSGRLMFAEDQKHPFAACFGSFNRSLLENRNYIDLNSLCHTSDLYRNIGKFDETLGKLADWDWILRASNCAQIYSVPVFLSKINQKTDINMGNKKDANLDILHEKQINRIKTADNSQDNISPVNNKVSIIIPSFEALEDLQECLESIYELNAGEWLEIVVVDNSSNQPVIDYLDQQADNGLIKLIKNNINYGFTYAVNQGIEIAESGNDIVIMNNDAILTPNAVKSMQRAAYQLSDCGIVVPRQVLPGDTKTINDHVPFADSKYECDVNLSSIHANIINVPVFHDGRVVELNFAPFFCVYITRDVLDNSVGLDAEYGRHYRSDRIFCNYIRHVMNLKVYYIEEAVVYHKLQKSTEELRDKPKKSVNFDIMYNKNQWDEDLATKFGYKTPIWDD